MSAMLSVSASSSMPVAGPQPGATSPTETPTGDSPSTGAVGQCITNLASISQDSKGFDPLAAMVIALLLQRGGKSEKDDQNDGWAMLAAMMIAGMNQPTQASSFQQVSTMGGGAYQSAAVAPAGAGASSAQLSALV